METETRNSKTMNLDKLSTLEALRVMNAEDKKVPEIIEDSLPLISEVVDETVEAFNNGGRLIYIGAGTSGRLGVLDAVECVPTFGTSPEMVQGIIAGGDRAIKYAVEGAEDSETLGKEDLQKIRLNENDIVIGLAASGRTPYVIGGLKYAQSVGAKTASISCNKSAKISEYAALSIEAEVGPEVITGSTRLKAGTAQKLILNMISSISMVKIGKVYENLMVDVKPSNLKLIDRSIRIIMEAADCSRETAAEAFEASEQHPKVAIIMILAQANKEEAERILEKNHGFIRKDGE